MSIRSKRPYGSNEATAASGSETNGLMSSTEGAALGVMDEKVNSRVKCEVIAASQPRPASQFPALLNVELRR